MAGLKERFVGAIRKTAVRIRKGVPNPVEELVQAKLLNHVLETSTSRKIPFSMKRRVLSLYVRDPKTVRQIAEKMNQLIALFRYNKTPDFDRVKFLFEDKKFFALLADLPKAERGKEIDKVLYFFFTEPFDNNFNQLRKDVFRYAISCADELEQKRGIEL